MAVPLSLICWRALHLDFVDSPFAAAKTCVGALLQEARKKRDGILAEDLGGGAGVGEKSLIPRVCNKRMRSQAFHRGVGVHLA